MRSAASTFTVKAREEIFHQVDGCAQIVCDIVYPKVLAFIFTSLNNVKILRENAQTSHKYNFYLCAARFLRARPTTLGEGLSLKDYGAETY